MTSMAPHIQGTINHTQNNKIMQEISVTKVDKFFQLICTFLAQSLIH